MLNRRIVQLVSDETKVKKRRLFSFELVKHEIFQFKVLRDQDSSQKVQPTFESVPFPRIEIPK